MFREGIFTFSGESCVEMFEVENFQCGDAWLFVRMFLKCCLGFSLPWGFGRDFSAALSPLYP